MEYQLKNSPFSRSNICPEKVHSMLGESLAKAENITWSSNPEDQLYKIGWNHESLKKKFINFVCIYKANFTNL